MKSALVFFSAILLSISACSDDTKNPSKDGGDQVPQPVENAGANTEAERAIEATVNDTTKSDQKKDSTK